MLEYDLVTYRFNREQEGFSPKFAKNTAIAVTAFVRWLEDTDRTVWTVDTATVRKYVGILLFTPAHNKSAPRKPGTVARILSQLRNFYNWGVENGHIGVNPTDGVKRPRFKDKFIEPLAPHEVEQLLQVAQNGRSPFLAARNHAIISLALDSGLRLSEMLNMNKTDVDRDVLVIRGKGDRTRRVALTSIPAQSITQMLGLRFDQNPALFVDQDGNRMSTTAAKDMMRQKKIQLGFPTLHFHNLRRTALTRMAAKGMPIIMLREIAGHEDIRTTDRYIRMAGQEQAVNFMRGMSGLG